MRNFAKHTITAIALVCLVQLTGCTGGENEAVAQEPQVDPRFASADALLTHYNSIATRDPVDPDAVMELMYAENSAQQKYINITRQMIPIAKLDHAMFEKFGECLEPKIKRHMLSPDEAARIIKREDSRCEAEYKDHKGNKETLYLVRIGERWWISGYTLEYDPELKQAMKDPSRISELEREMQTMGSAAQPITAKIRAGEFKAADDARKAFVQAVVTQTLQQMKR